MAACRSCGAQIGASAWKCQQCGSQTATRGMVLAKSVIVVVLVGLLIGFAS
jgi:RNA polymerase subunit RPABC4/transcription elongation factor Spt4